MAFSLLRPVHWASLGIRSVPQPLSALSRDAINYATLLPFLGDTLVKLLLSFSTCHTRCRSVWFAISLHSTGKLKSSPFGTQTYYFPLQSSIKVCIVFVEARATIPDQRFGWSISRGDSVRDTCKPSGPTIQRRETDAWWNSCTCPTFSSRRYRSTSDGFSRLPFYHLLADRSLCCFGQWSWREEVMRPSTWFLSLANFLSTMVSVAISIMTCFSSVYPLQTLTCAMCG